MLFLLACAPENTITKDPSGFDPGDSGWTPDSGDSAADSEIVEVCNGADDDGDGDVDEGFPDADGDGRADCVDATCPDLEVAVASTVPIDAACELSDVKDPWDLEMSWNVYAPSSGGPNIEAASAPVIGFLRDDNGDGDIGPGDRAQVLIHAINTEASSDLVAVDAADGTETWDRQGMAVRSSTAIGDVDGDGLPDIISHANPNQPTALEADGTTKWEAPAQLEANRIGVPTIVDLDGDGYAEIVDDSRILDGATGAHRATLVPTESTLYDRSALVVDLEDDGHPEILLSGSAFDADGNELWTVMDGHDHGPSDSVFMVPVDIDEDGVAEVMITGGPGKVGATVDANGVIQHDDAGFVGPNDSSPCTGDIDGDGVIDLVLPRAGGATTARNLDWDIKWSNTSLPLDTAQSGCSTFDLDNDGAAEVLITANAGFVILDGKDGSTLWSDTGHTGNYGRHYSPVVADTNGDGHAEIYATASYYSWGILAAFRQADNTWPGAGPVWPMYNYTATAYNVDGSLPADPEPGWKVDGLLRGRPPDVTAPDLEVRITDYCTADCTNGPVEVAVQVSNHGPRDVAAGATLTLSTNEDLPRLLATTTLPAVPAGSALDGVRFELPLDQLVFSGVRATVDAGSTVEECDETDNTDTWADVDCWPA